MFKRRLSDFGLKSKTLGGLEDTSNRYKLIQRRTEYIHHILKCDK